MHLIVVGCEYSGVTTLIDSLMEWGDARGIQHHLDDHFAIPDSQQFQKQMRNRCWSSHLCSKNVFSACSWSIISA